MPVTNPGGVHGVMDAGQYDTLIGTIVPGQPLLLSTIIESLPGHCRRVLELGCGTGILTAMIREACPNAEVTGIDLSPEMLEVAAEKPQLSGVTFIAGDLRDPWPGEKFDAVVTSLCLHHVSPGDRHSVAWRAANVLEPGGRFICGDIFRAAHDWEERLLTDSWKKAMERRGASNDVIKGMLRQRDARRPELSTIDHFQKTLREAGFTRCWVPFVAGFVALVVGEIPVTLPPRTRERPDNAGFEREGFAMCRP